MLRVLFAMHLCRLTALVASIGLAAGLPVAPVSPPIVPAAPVSPSSEEEVCKIPTPPYAFKPWYTYKYLKASPHYIETEEKNLMGGQTMNIKKADNPIAAASFTCVAQDGEWKARVKSPALDILTMEIDTGMENWRTGGTKEQDISERCLLQDISLYRTRDGIPGLRLDYGHCQKMATEQAFIMVGLKKVANDTLTPNLRGFFEETCDPNRNKSLPFPEQFLDLRQAIGYGDYCFAASADMQKMRSLIPGCFNTSTAYTFLDGVDEFPLLPVTEGDWDWLISNLPVQSMAVDTLSNPCAPVNHHIRTYGSVTVDRLCVNFEGLTHLGKKCNNKCGKWCEAVEQMSALMPMAPPAGYCYDCEFQEALYLIIAPPIVMYLTYYVFLAFSQAKKGMGWKPANPEDAAYRTIAQQQGGVNQGNLHTFRERFGFHPRRMRNVAIIAGLATLFVFIILNLVDYVITVKILGHTQCIRIFPFQYMFDSKHWMQLQGTYAKHEAYLHQKYKDDWPEWLPSTFYPWLDDLNPGYCPYRIFYMMAITFLSVWHMTVAWKNAQLPEVKETVSVVKYVAEDEGVDATTGLSGAFVTAIQSIGGVGQTQPDEMGAAQAFRSQAATLVVPGVSGAAPVGAVASRMQQSLSHFDNQNKKAFA